MHNQQLCNIIRETCGFADEDDDSYIITGGGDYPYTTVSKYNKDGWMEDLPDLNKGRYFHGCGTYLDDNNNRVSSVYICSKNNM